MSRENVELVGSLYEIIAKGEIPKLFDLYDPEIEWREAEHHPYADGNPYIGPDAVIAGVFARLRDEWEGFAAHPEEILDAGDTVVVLGRYTGTYRATGRRLDAQLVHVYRLQAGKVVALRQYTDTAQFAQVTEGV